MNLSSGGQETFRQSKETGKKIAKSKKGKKYSPELCAKLSEAHKGLRPPNRKFTDEQIFEIRKEYLLLRQKKVKFVVNQLAKKYNISFSTMQKITSNNLYKAAGIPEIPPLKLNEKACASCNLIKDKSNFYISDNSTGELYTQCKICSEESRKKSKNKNKEKPIRFAKTLDYIFRDNKLVVDKNKEYKILQITTEKDCVWIKTKTKGNILLYKDEYQIILKIKPKPNYDTAPDFIKLRKLKEEVIKLYKKNNSDEKIKKLYLILDE